MNASDALEHAASEHMAAEYARAPAAVAHSLHILLVQASLDVNAELLGALKEGGLDPSWERVDTVEDLEAALKRGTWDAVLSAIALPTLGAAAAALSIVRRTDPDIPFIVISSAEREDGAVALMRATASDYILKRNLVQLAPTLEREVREARDRRAKRAAERAAAHLASVVESSDDAIISKTLDGIITTWNPAAEDLYGWTAAQAAGRHVSFLIPVDKVSELDEQMARLTAGEHIGYFETVRLHRDGHRIDVAMTISCVRNAAGRIVGVSKTARDIQQRKKAEKLLRRSEERYRGLIETIPALVWVYDAEGKALLHNHQWYDYTGQSVEDVSADRWHEALHPDDAAAALAAWARCSASGEPYACEYRIRRKDGVYRWFRSQGTTMGSSDGVVQWIGLCTDINDLKQTEVNLRGKTNLLHSVVEGTTDAVYIKDRDGRYELFNEAAARFVGQTVAEVIGKDDTALFEPEDAFKIMANDRSIMATGRSQTMEETLTAAGNTRVYLTMQTPHRDAAGDIVGIIGIARDVTDRKRAERSLAASEARYRRLFEAAQDGILILDPASRQIHDANPFVTKLLGYSRETLIGKELWEIGLFHDIEANKEAFRSLQATGYIRYDDLPLQTVDCRAIAVEFVSNVYDVGEERVIQCNIRDITERKGTEAAVRLSEERYRTLIAATAAIVWNTAASGEFDSLQPQWTKFTGQTVEQHRGWGWLDAVHPDDRDRSARAWTKALAVYGNYEVEHRLRRADGEYRRMSVRAVPILDAGNTVREWVGVHTDVTEQRQAEDALLLRDRAIRAATQGLLITDPGQRDNPVVYVNPGFETMTGYSHDEISGRNCRILQGKDTDPSVVASIHDAIASGEPGSFELLNYRKDGSTFWNELSISPIRDPAGRITHFVGVQTDVTARRKLEEQFRQVQKMEAVGKLAGGVAHDFNNLLTIINGYSDLLLDTLASDDPSREMIEEIRSAGERSAALTRQLLAFSRQQVLTPQILDLNEVVGKIEKLLRRLIGEDVQFVTSLASGIWPVRADPGQIEQVLMNFAVNARDAMPRGGRLTIETLNVELDGGYARNHPDAQAGPHVLLGVTDTGCGMTPGVKARVFEPFFTTKGPGKGTGLGLATAYGIIKQTGGHLAVYSEAGIGTTFKVYLPRAVPAAGGAKTLSGIKTPLRGTETILLVEDDDGVRALTRHILIGWGYSVLEAANLEAAVRAMDEHRGPIHLLVSDVVLPGAGGRIVAESVTRIHPEARVLFLSGYPDDAVIRHGVLSEGVNFLQKPFSPAALAFKVRHVLDAPAEAGRLR